MKFAHIQNNIVDNTILADQSFIDLLPNSLEYVETPEFAGIGDTYDPIAKVFYSPQPYPSWILNTETWLWEAPIPMPTDGAYKWDEFSLTWQKVES